MSERITKRRKLRKTAVGDMRERITLKRRELSAPGFGEHTGVETLTDIATVWASVSTSEAFISSGEKDYNSINLKTAPSVQFTIRYRSDIEASDTVVLYDDTLYAIDRIEDPEKRKQYLVLSSVSRGDDSLEANQ